MVSRKSPVAEISISGLHCLNKRSRLTAVHYPQKVTAESSFKVSDNWPYSKYNASDTHTAPLSIHPLIAVMEQKNKTF